MTKATVVITTKDRCELLCNAINSVLSQDTEVELIVVDDGSKDQTSEVVRTKFPSVTLIRNEAPLGIIAARNNVLPFVKNDILFTLDDDAVYSSTNTVSKVLKHFEDKFVGAVTIPYIDHIGDTKRSIDLVDWASESDFPCVASYNGCLNAKRTQTFRELGGYSGKGRQGEETAFCQKLLEHGYVVRIADVSLCNHFPEQSNARANLISYSLSRNSINFAWEHVPSIALLPYVFITIAKQLSVGLKNGTLPLVWSGVRDGVMGLRDTSRRPVSYLAFRTFRYLRKQGPLPFSKIAPQLKQLRKRAEVRR